MPKIAAIQNGTSQNPYCNNSTVSELLNDNFILSPIRLFIHSSILRVRCNHIGQEKIKKNSVQWIDINEKNLAALPN